MSKRPKKKRPKKPERPENFIRLQIVDIQTGQRTQSQTFTAPLPGMMTIWNVRPGFPLSNDIEIRFDWPMKK